MAQDSWAIDDPELVHRTKDVHGVTCDVITKKGIRANTINTRSLVWARLDFENRISEAHTLVDESIKIAYLAKNYDLVIFCPKGKLVANEFTQDLLKVTLALRGGFYSVNKHQVSIGGYSVGATAALDVMKYDTDSPTPLYRAVIIEPLYHPVMEDDEFPKLKLPEMCIITMEGPLCYLTLQFARKCAEGRETIRIEAYYGRPHHAFLLDGNNDMVQRAGRFLQYGMKDGCRQ